MIQFRSNGRHAVCLLPAGEKLTTGSVGIPVKFTFSEDWSGLSRTAVFRGSEHELDVPLTGDSCLIPPEVLTLPGDLLTIGVYGTDGSGERVIPTIFALAGRIHRGAAPTGIEPTPQTAPLIDQLLSAADAAHSAADAARSQADQALDTAQEALDLARQVDPDVVYVNYGSGTYQEIGEMLGEGRLPLCFYGDLQLPYIGETELAGDLGFLFAAYSPEDNAMVTATCLDNGEWSHRSIPIPSPAQSTVYDRPRMDGTSSAGSSAKYARADHVHPKDTSKLDLDQGTANAGKFLVVGSDGNIAPVTMAAWEGGSY